VSRALLQIKTHTTYSGVHSVYDVRADRVADLLRVSDSDNESVRRVLLAVDSSRRLSEWLLRTVSDQ